MLEEEKIYKAYPRRSGKKNALMSIRKALRDNSFDYLLEKTEAYAKLWQGVSPSHPDFQFIPHPATWFNQERYDDEHWAGPKVQATTRNTSTNQSAIDQYR